MQEILDQVFAYLKGIWNKRWYAMVFAWLACIVGWVYVYTLPDQYESRAKIYIDTQSLLRPLLRGMTVETDLDQQISLMVRTLLSRPNIEKIIRLSDLDLTVQTNEQFDGLVKKLQKKIKFSKPRRQKANIYDLKYGHLDPQTAQVVLQSVITVFIENSIGESKEETVTARNFLDSQIKEYERRLLEAENRLKDFKQKNVGMLPSAGGKDYYGKMESAKENLDEANLNLREAQRRQKAIQTELAELREKLSSAKADVQYKTIYDERLIKVGQEVDDLLLTYTELHPDVQAKKRLLVELEKRRNAEIEALKNSAGSETNALEANPVYQEVKIRLGEAIAETESLRVRVIEYNERYKKLQNLVNTIPEIEAQLTALNRDYEITKKKYTEFLSRRESASIAESVDATTESVQFKVVEAPRVENKPVGPDRIILSSIALVLGIGGGIGISFLLSQLRPVIMSGKQVAELTGVPVFGYVSAVISPGQRRRRRMLVFTYLSLSMALVGCYGLIISWYFFTGPS